MALDASETHEPLMRFMFFSIDRQGVWRYVSPSVQRILGYSDDSVINTDCENYLVGDHRFDRFPVSARYPFVVCARHADGTERFLEVTLLDADDPSGSDQTYGLAEDVTTREHEILGLRRANLEIDHAIARQNRKLKELEAQQNQNKSRIHAIAGRKNEYVLRWFPNGDCIFASDAFYKVFQISPDDAVLADIYGLIHADDRDQVREEMQSLSVRQPTTQVRFRTVLPSGDLAWHHRMDRAIFDKHGRLIEYQSVGIDITERKIREDRAREQLSELTALISGMVHEVNQPLSTVCNFSEAAVALLGDKENVDLTELRRLAESISESARFAGSIVKNFGCFASQPGVQKSTHFLDDLVRASLTMMGADAERRCIRLNFAASERRIQLLVDGTQIQQVLVNLLRNAFDAVAENPEDDRTVTVRISPAGTGAEIAVLDSGPGVSDLSEGSPFDPFRSSKVGGLGIGLAICRRIVEAHGGTISYEPVEPHGTAFLVRIP